jgi:hypothetical protein
MGNPRSPESWSRMTGLALASAPVRTLVIAAAVLAVGVSFALVAGAMSLLRAPTSTTQSVLLDPDPQAALSSQPSADTHAGTPSTAPDTTVVGASGSPAAGSELSRAQAIALVQGRYRARVVRTTLSQDKDGRRLYVFRLLSGSGKVWTVRIDAQTGAEVP